KAMRIDRLGIELAKTLSLGRGIAADLPSGWTGFVRSSPEVEIPDIQLLFRAGPIAAYPYLPPFKLGFPDGFACRAVLLRPESAGKVSLASGDPFAAPKIQLCSYAVEKDRRALRGGLRLVHSLGRQPSVAPFVDAEISPNF